MSQVKEINFYSNMLRKDSRMLVYLPENNSSSEQLPVLYFLHGRSGNENILYELNINTKADKMIKNGEIKPFIIVCPRMENSRGINSAPICKEIRNPDDGENSINIGMYEDYFIKEIIPMVDSTFNTMKEKKGR